MPYIPHNDEETSEMLKVVGVKSLDDLFAYIPKEMRPKSFDLPSGLTEYETATRLAGLAASNCLPGASFAGAGFYDHVIPAAVDALTSRGEFLTAYTPYQAEAAQGTLQAIFEYQTIVCRLLDMDIANASVYDGGSAVFEAAMMAVRATRRNRLLVDAALNPLYRKMLFTLTANLELEIQIIEQQNGLTDKAKLLAELDANGDKIAAVVLQNPTFFGNVQDYSDVFAKAKSKGALSILSVYPVMQAILKTPREMGADIAVADGQSLGQPLNFGGPYLGMMACTKELVRQIPGRIVGRTNDLEGKTGYVLTLQAREQHIRRAKATSNICSNQALCALRALAHLCLLGPKGLTAAAERSLELAHFAAKRICSLPGVSLLNQAPFGNEFAVRLPKQATQVVASALEQGILPGVPLGRWYPDMDSVLLIACTEKNSEEQIDALVQVLGESI
ncbi:MAG: aminomethyl-transferring glycine dehydrogenase subunit GcvPA [Deltaproteobacteria bacterium]|jgi:glycine dehydrogenase subunit 1|nr:aminomethyl-transferring glycine dehydrogenase subunit GcvPA [Deltaproteobacteria bacterium]